MASLDEQNPLLDLPEALAELVLGRIEAVHFCPESGLLCLSVYVGRKGKVYLGFGLGPRVVGVGLLPRLPKARAPSSFPLLAALRAHFVDRRLTRFERHADGRFVLAVDAPQDDAPQEVAGTLPLTLFPGPHGHAHVLLPSGAVLAWPKDAPPSSAVVAPLPLPFSLDAHGKAMVDESDALFVETLKRSLLRVLKAKRKSLLRRVEAVTQDLSRLEQAPRLQKLGQLLLAQAHRIPRGATRVTLTDWETGGPIEVDLAPDKPGKLQAETFFQKARRLQRGAAIMQARLFEAQTELQTVDALLGECASTPLDAALLAALSSRIRAANIPVVEVAFTSVPVARADKTSAERKPFHSFLGEKDRLILVGRGGKDNDALITRFARPHDLWLHAKNIHGAHVVVPLDKGESCPSGLLVDAATLAAHFSDARGASLVEVSYVERRYVRKPKRAAPGAVTFEREKVVVLRLEPDRLARLLASKRQV